MAAEGLSNNKQSTYNARAYACRAADDEIRMGSSSGGIFPLLAEKILEDGGVVFGAAFDEAFHVVHIAAETGRDLEKLYGSKYVFGRIGDSYAKCREYLRGGRKVLFSGLPCQIAGLRAYLKDEPSELLRNLYTADCICHGTPPDALWQRYLKELSGTRKPVRVGFRGKEHGWTGYQTVVEFDDGSEYRVHHEADPYMQGFVGNLILRPACYRCRFKGTDGRNSDLTLGDLWGAERIMPELFDDRGTSFVMVNSGKGRRMLSAVRDRMDAAAIDLNTAIRYNPMAVSVPKPHPNRKKFEAYYQKTGELTESIRRYMKVPLVRRAAGRLRRSISAVRKK